MRPTGVESANLGHKIRINLDDVSFLEQKNNEIDDTVTLQVSGVPVTVNPVIARPTGVESANMGERIRINLDYVNFLQTKEQGVPVLVQPTLLKNEAAEVDLQQRNYVIEGVDGFAFTQIDADGVPVHVNPKLQKDEMADHDFGETMTVGGDKVKFDAEDVVTLQVNGVPVTVKGNPAKDEMADHDFGETMTVGGDKVKFDADEAVTLQVNGVPVLVNPTLMKDEMADTPLGHKVVIGPDEVPM